MLEQAHYYLQIVLDPMMDLLQENVFFEKRGTQALFGSFALGLIPHDFRKGARLSIGSLNQMCDPASPKRRPSLRTNQRASSILPLERPL